MVEFSKNMSVQFQRGKSPGTILSQLRDVNSGAQKTHKP